MAPRPDVSQERRNQIIAAAIAVFTRLGFHEARIEDIAKEAKLSKGALYWYFKSKDDIIAAIMDHFIGREIVELEEALKLQAPISEKLMKLNGMIVDEMQSMLDLMPILYEFYAAATRRKDVRKALLQYFRPTQQLLSRLIQQGLESGEFVPVDAEVVAVDFIALYEGLLLLAVLDPKTIDLKKMGAHGVNLMIEGLKVKS
ncbi:MAG TPA: TetR/AcrR family transcriptional regulator [Anaerolineae bacterium]|nr:TetR/AcrR family transcriptional regulator [Anaerolineae bacterium]